MTRSIGSAASPRWYDLTLAGLDRFIGRVIDWGGASTELLLHHGPSDLRIARFHVLEEDWRAVSSRFIAAGIACHVHAPLEPRFSLRRWAEESDAVRAEHGPILREAGRIADAQGRPVVVVVHAAHDERATADYLAWAEEEAARDDLNLRLAIELRHALGGVPERCDTDRRRLSALVERVGSPRVGICWDLAHDWENRLTEPDWTAAAPRPFLDRVIHVHAHDAGPDGAVHYPLTIGRVPLAEQLSSLDAYDGAITLEVRYRLALALGDPIEQLGASYHLLGDALRQPVRSATIRA